MQGTDVRTDVWLVDRWTGQPSGRDPRQWDDAMWVDRSGLSDLRLADPRLATLFDAALD